MNAPEKIYIQQDMINNIPLEQKEFDDDVEYIRKDSLLEWAKELTSEPYDRTTESARKHQIARYLLEKYNSL